MRTTLTLDEDVARKLKAESRRLDRSFRDVVNEILRRGLANPRAKTSARPRFKVQARDLGNLRPGVSLDNIAELIELVEGGLHR
jgi:hypothetical protein